ncbi:MAG: GyrI-like domain-containing protein, partial [Pseudonocardiales bacterium]|nr:GyrI-like domain-containing protein [Pseudonocardiales bacterium]
LVVDGRGGAEGLPFAAAVRALFRARAALGAPMGVPLEGTYAQDGDPLRFHLDEPAGWHWTLAVPAPEGCTARTVAALDHVAPVALRVQGGHRAAQLVHAGRYEDEAPSLAALYGFVAGRGLRPAGAHTEVYLTDPTVTEPSRNRTILRVPVWTA